MDQQDRNFQVILNWALLLLITLFVSYWLFGCAPAPTMSIELMPNQDCTYWIDDVPYYDECCPDGTEYVGMNSQSEIVCVW